MKRHLAVLGIVAGLANAIPATADDVVARVGDHDISIQEYESRARDLRRTGYSHLTEYDLDAKKQLLEGMIAQDLLVLEGARRGVGDDPEIARELARSERRILMNALYEREALTGDYDSATEEELRAFFAERDYDVEVLSRHIVCSSEADAREVLAALAAGTFFEDLIPRYSTPAIQRRFGPTGNVGWFRLGEVYEELREAMRTMPEESLYPEPLESEVGWHVFYLIERRPVDFEDSLDFVAERLRIQKRADDMQAYVDGLRRRYQVRIDDDALRVLASVPADATVFSGPDRELIRWDGGQLTVAQYMERVASRLAPHPARRDSAGLRKAVDNQAGQKVMIAEARRLGIDREPEIRTELDDRRRDLFSRWLFEVVRRDATADTSDANVRGFYDQNQDLFTRADSTVAPYDLVAKSIRSLLVRDAERRAMDAFIARLRRDHADRIEVHEDVLARALPDGIPPRPSAEDAQGATGG